MSHTFVEVCPLCLNKTRHWHRKDHLIVAEQWFGGNEKGIQVQILDKEPKVLMDSSFEFILSANEFITYKELLSREGQGKI